MSIDLPPQRRRQEDIALLAERFLAFFARQTRWPVVGFYPAALEALQRHSWPGNAIHHPAFPPTSSPSKPADHS